MGNGIAVDEKRKAGYVTGSTDSGDFPITPGAHGPNFSGGSDAFVTSLRASEGDDDEHDEDDEDEDDEN